MFLINFQGCADVVIDGVRHNLGQIAGGAIALGLIEVTQAAADDLW